MKRSTNATHYAVYRESGRFAGWPANYGMWSWQDEIAVVFTEGRFANLPQGHKRDKDSPFATVVGRSLDGGESWTVEPFTGPTPKNRALSADEHMAEALQIGNPYEGENPPKRFDGNIDFTDPEQIVMAARTTCHGVPEEVHSWFHLSRDRCRSWEGPFTFHGIDHRYLLAARTDIVPITANQALFLITAHKHNGEEGKVICAETIDGGRTFSVKAELKTEEPEGFEIMPSSLALGNRRILTAVRAQLPGKHGSIRLYASNDIGATWEELSPAAPSLGESGSNPPAMVRTPSGRIGLLFGYRNPPYGIHGRYSDDEGMSWSDDIVLRDDGGDSDIGYPKAVLRADGKIVTCYYYNTHTDSERFIGATVWDVDGEN